MRTRSILAARFALLGFAVLASAILTCLSATTLQKLSLEDMIQQSTGIVRATVTGSQSVLRGTSIYTYYHLHVLEAPKESSPQGNSPKGGTAATDMEVAVPGGSLNGIRQVAVGAPALNAGSEYVVFLWTGKSGMTQIIGLSQGLFQTSKDSSGNIRLIRPSLDEPMVDKTGRAVSGDAIGISWTDLRSRIRKELAK